MRQGNIEASFFKVIGPREGIEITGRRTTGIQKG